MSSDDADKLLDNVRKRAEERYRKRLEPKAEAYHKTIEELINDDIEKQKGQRRQTLYNMIASKQFEDQIIKGEKYIDRALPGAFIGYESNVFKSRDSVINSIRTHQIRTTGNFLSNLYKTKTYDLFNNRKISSELSKALWDRSSANEKVNQLADVIKGVQKYSREMMSEVGVDPSEAENYTASTVHVKRKMLSGTGSGIKDSALRARLLAKYKGNYRAADIEFRDMAYNRWKNTIAPLTDEDRTFERGIETPEDEEKFFKSFYESVTKGIRRFPVVNNVEVGHPFITNIGANIRNKLEAERVWFPKDGESWDAYNKEYGYGTTQDAIVAQLNKISHSVGVMKKLGSSPAVSGERIIRKIGRKFRDDPRITKATKNARKALKAIISDPTDDMDGFVGKIFHSLNFMAYARLGSIALSSIPDVNTIASALRPFGVKFLEANASFIKELLSGMPKGEYRELGLNLGTYSEGTMGSMYSRFGSIGNPGVYSKLLEIQDKLSLINYWDNIGRFSMGVTLSNQFSRLLDKSFSSLNDLASGSFTKYGIDEGFWNLLKNSKGDIQPIRGRKFITPSIIDNIDEDDLLNYYYGKNIKRNREFKLNLAKTDLKNRLLNFFVDGSSYGKIFPDAGDLHIARFRSTSPPNSIPGQLLKMITTFKSFGVAQTRRTLGRFLYAKGATSIYDALVNGKADYGGLAQYMLGSIPYGYISMASKYIARGDQPPDLRKPETWKDILMSGGTLFSYGDLVYDAYGKNGRVGSSILGPQINTAKDILNIIGELGAGKIKSAQKGLLNIVQYNTPIINTFYFKKALDLLLFNKLHEAVDPTYQWKEREWQQRNGMKPLF
ncbi:MAG: hypothetical protein ACTSR1_00230 [Candidatus Heimdallarchaeota archaeon]